jgi:hypothetical protein
MTALTISMMLSAVGRLQAGQAADERGRDGEKEDCYDDHYRVHHPCS